LDELDAARQGNNEAMSFVNKSGFYPFGYTDEMQNSFEEADCVNGPQHLS
jgi:hypothetical protein